MKKITNSILAFILTSLFGASTSAQFSLAIESVVVGNAGNADDSTGFGGVDYTYQIGTYEVTNAQYASFLNAVASSDPHGLYITPMGGSFGGITRSGSSGSYTYSTISGRENNPVTFVSFWDAARFVNWLTTGNTETGVYQLSAAGISNNSIVRDPTAWAAGGVAVASEDEWYKAAYYDPTKNNGAGGYWLYPNQADAISITEANYANSTGVLTEAGSYTGVSSYYGTYDQGGNVWEWNEDIFDGGASRILRGGALQEPVDRLSSSHRETLVASDFYADRGFRITSLAPIPEPATVGTVFGLFALVFIGRRRLNRRQRS